MGQKVHRRRRSYRRRPSPVLKQVLVWALVAVIVIPTGFFGAKWLFGRQTDVPAVGDGGETHATTQSTTATTVPPAAVHTDTMRGFTLGYAQLKDVKALQSLAKEAADNGFNCAVVELKDNNGRMAYVSETEAGKQAAAANADALTLKEVTDAFRVLKETGITPIPLLYAFEDGIASRNIPLSKVTVAGHGDWTWYDGDPQKGGRAWLNPYADAAQAYIAALVEELNTAGAGAVMLDGVYFPGQTLQAEFTVAGSESLSKGQVLAQFMSRLDTVSSVPIILRCHANAALGNNTAGYYTNPLTLGAAMVVADTRVETLGKKMKIGEEMLPVSADVMPELVGKLATALEKRAGEQTENRPATALWVTGDNAAEQTQTLGDTVSYFTVAAN